MTSPSPNALPHTAAPMLATPGPVPTGKQWSYEFKWDGLRALTWVTTDGLRILSRNERDITGGYPELTELVNVVGARRVVLDGEIVALDEHGRPSFARLQHRMHVRGPVPSLLRAVPVHYHVFDVLYLDGEPVLDLPYHDRRDLLAALNLTGNCVRVPQHFVDVDGDHVMTAAKAYGLEGIMAKRVTSTYQPGRRSRDWIKIPISATQEVVIVGYKPGEGRRTGTIGSLLVAVTGADGTLAFAGGVGTGFTDAMLRDLQKQLAALNRPDPPLDGVPREYARGAQWVNPVLIGEAAFRNWTPDNRLRHPSWRGLRPDKSAPVRAPGVAQVHPEVEGAMQTSDGSWRVDIIRGASGLGYRVVHHDNVIDWLSLTDVEDLLRSAGIDMSDLAAAPVSATNQSDATTAAPLRPGHAAG
jgi:bifunctional non-homologous end joining protein LigD